MRSVRKLNKQTIITSAILTFAICAGLMFVSFLYAKYIREFNFSGNVTISADLADTFTLLEHEVTQNSDGSYNVNEQTVTENEYYVLPGINIPKDPTITIEGKTSIPSYLFIEVVDNLDHNVITFDIDDSHWQVVQGAESLNDGTVYVFTIDGTPAVLDDKTNDELIKSIGIIKGNTLNVTSIAKDSKGNDIDFYSSPVTVDDLNFYGYLVQINTGESVSDVFNKLKSVNPAAPAQTEASTETGAVTETTAVTEAP